MRGKPVWLASVALRDSFGRIVPTGRWTERQQGKAERLVERLLDGVGDLSREVAFRMNVTLCRHRGMTEQEEAGLSSDFRGFAPTDSAGSAVELLWARGVSGDAIQPCERPGRRPIPNAADPDQWLPEPCGTCPPCRARDALTPA